MKDETGAHDPTDDEHGGTHDRAAEARDTARAFAQTGAHPRLAIDSTAHLGSAGIGFFYAWLFLVCFSQCLFPGVDIAADLGTWVELASFAGYLAAIAVFVAGYRRMRAWNKAEMWGGTALMTVGTVVLAIVPYVYAGAPTPTLEAVLFCASFLSGIGSGVLLVRWAWAFVVGRESPVVQFAGGLLLSFCIAGIALILPPPTASIVSAVLPLLSGAAIARASGILEARDATVPHVMPKSLVAHWIPRRLAVGLIAMGAAYGMAYQFTFEVVLPVDDRALCCVCLLVNGLLAAVILGYAYRGRGNFGYGSANIAILPIAAFAQGIVLTYGAQHVYASFFLMRLAYVMFDALLWLQMPRVYEHMGTIRAFLQARLYLECSVALGIVVRFAIGGLPVEVDRFVQLVALGALLVALTIAFRGDSIGSVWNLFSKSTVRTGKFRDACARIEADYSLTPREAEIMRLVLRGRNGTYVTEHLYISKSTFQTHMRNLYHKLDVHSNQELLDVLEHYLDERKNGEAAPVK